ncbi:MAG: 16S rRNA (guanine(966)-N(2))-methyltransferase RsmD [Phycisphaerales bacterium]
MLRIIAGEYRSRLLRTPPGKDVTRPMAGRVKESVFNLLRGWIEDASVLDLFAGVGNVGLEAISRGARSVVMVEQHRPTFRLLQENIEALGCEDRAIAWQGDALSSFVFERAQQPIDVVFLDPPYRMMHDDVQRQAIIAQMQRAIPSLNAQAILVLRSPLMPTEINFDIADFDGPEMHDYGHDMQVRLYMHRAARMQVDANE